MNSLFSRAAVAGLLMGAAVVASAADTALKSQEPPKDAKVFIVSPADGATVDKTFTVKFGIEASRSSRRVTRRSTRAIITCWWMWTRSLSPTSRCRPV